MVDGKPITVFILEDYQFGSVPQWMLDLTFSHNDDDVSVPAFWLYRSQGKAFDKEEGQLEKFIVEASRTRFKQLEEGAKQIAEEERRRKKEEEENNDDEEEGGFEIIGGNDNDDKAPAGTPLNKDRPIKDGTNGTIRIAEDSVKGGELEGEQGSSNGGLSGTVRFAPGLDHDLTESSYKDYHVGIYNVLDDIMSGGGGFDPPEWDDNDDDGPLGDFEGEILP